jgi:tetratricopeptide (TPR) repeat protein
MNRKSLGAACLVAISALIYVPRCVAQSSASAAVHQVEGRLRAGNNAASNVRVRLIRQDQRRPIGDTYSRSRGEFEFTLVPEGEYLVETSETDVLEASSTQVHVRPIPRERPTVVYVDIDIALKTPAAKVKPGVIAADVDLNVPKAALNHYKKGLSALDEGKPALAVDEFWKAINIYSNYYGARLQLGRELRLQKKFQEAREVLRPLPEIAPRRAEAKIEYGIVLLELGDREEAAEEFTKALGLNEANWATHLYLGWALLEKDADSAEPHFKRALELNEQKAARAHLALARIADAKGLRQLAIDHLEAYLKLAPDAADAESARLLAERLRR